MSPSPEQFFSLGSLGTLAGATGATFVVTNGLARAFNWAPRWVGLVVAQAVCFVFASPIATAPIDYLIVVLNGFLVFCTAAGVSGAAAQAVGTTRQGAAEDRYRKYPRFIQAWF
jgi:hypothetical protein